jgi:hypothetical protein
MFNWPWYKSRSTNAISEPTKSLPELGVELDIDTLDPSKIRYNGNAPKDRYDQIEYVFTSGGVNYFKFSAEVNIPFQRAMAARDILTEELWQISPNTLRAWNESLIGVIVSDKIKPEKKLYEIGILAHRLKEQMELSYSLVRQLKLASVLYFDEQENPLDYQHPYNQTKIKTWLQNNDIDGFFLNLPDFGFLPSTIELSKNFKTYLAAESKNQINLLSHIIFNLPSSDTSEDLKNSLLSQIAELNELNTY